MLPLLLSLLACVDPDPSAIEADRGTMELCLGSDGDAAITGEANSFRFDGAVVLDTAAADVTWSEPIDDIVGCGAEPSRVLEVLADDGTTWWVGYGHWDEGGADGTPALEVGKDTPVSVVFRAVASFGSAAGLAIHSDETLVLAMEKGTWGNALKEGDVPELSVSFGAVLEETSSGCADIRDHSLLFAGDNEVEVRTGEVGELRLGGVPMTASAVSAWEYVAPVCPDGAGEVLWSVARTPTE